MVANNATATTGPGGGDGRVPLNGDIAVGVLLEELLTAC